MRCLVTYTSQTGNTRKLAEAVFDSILADKDYHTVGESPDPAAYDWIFVGFWLMAGKPEPKAAAFLSSLPAGKNVFLFATHGASAASDHAVNAMNHARNLVKGSVVVGTFNCQGEVNPVVLEKVASKNPPPPWLPDAPKAVGKPDREDIKSLKDLISELFINQE